MWASLGGCAHVCGINFKNFFQRIESLYQRTLIRILYEFLEVFFKIYVRKDRLCHANSFSQFFKQFVYIFF